MNHMRENASSRKAFFSQKEKIGVITHSDSYADYKTCQDAGIEPAVIANGVSLREFEDCEIDFRKKYAIETPGLVVCVSNFFPGKGQDHLVKALDRLSKRREDFSAVFVSTRVNFPYAQTISANVQRSLSRLRTSSRFLVDIPRSDVVAAFRAATVFAFPSQKEVAPIVVLESMAASAPWIAMPVGDVATLPGGRLVPFRGYDPRGYLVWREESYATFVDHIDNLLEDSAERESLGTAGRAFIEAERDWSKIVPRYESFFEQFV